MRHIGVVLPFLFNNLGIEDAVNLKLLRKKWSEIFSSPLRDYTYPKELKGDCLYVVVSSHAWLNELKLFKADFITKLFPYGIKDVEFKFGKIYNSKQKNNRDYENISISKQQEQWINDIVKKVNDDEMKLVIKSLIRKHLENINTIIKGENNERF